MDRHKKASLCSRSIAATLWVLMLWCLSQPTLAQWGFPLVGSWSGYWGADEKHQTRVLLAMKFSVDQVISGFIIEKGVRIPLKSASLNPDTWTVTMTAERKEPSTGKNVEISITGTIKNLSSATARTISGTWKEGNSSGPFHVVING